MAMNTLISAVKAYVARAVAKLPSREELQQAKDEVLGEVKGAYLRKADASRQYLMKEEAAETYATVDQAGGLIKGFASYNIDSGTWSAQLDLTRNEIEAAYKSNKTVVLVLRLVTTDRGNASVILPMTECEVSGNIVFSGIGATEANKSSLVGNYQYLVRVKRDGTVEFSKATRTLDLKNVNVNGSVMQVFDGEWKRCDAPILVSPSGKKYKLTVDDSGTLTATEVTE